MSKLLHIIVKKPLLVSTVVATVANFYILYNSNIYYILNTGIPLSITSILYHYKCRIPGIKYIDMCLALCASTQYLYTGMMYSNKSYYLLIFGNGAFLYLLGKILEHLHYDRSSDHVHALLHYVIIIGLWSLKQTSTI